MVTFLEGGDTLAHFDDDTGGFVTKDKGRGVWDFSGGGGLIAVADAAGTDLDGNLIPFGAFHGDGLYLNGLPPFAADDCLCLSVHSVLLLGFT